MSGTINVELDDTECSALHRLSRQHDLPQDRILIQALRFYDLHNSRLKNGETCTYSGDEQRAKEFYNC